MAKTHVHVIISGRVQGVWFRVNTKNKAKELGVTGWVYNTPDGKVEAVFEGEEKLVQEMIDWCRHGPPRAKVEELKVKKQPYLGEFESFSIKY